jgi:hypothetical protein
MIQPTVLEVWRPACMSSAEMANWQEMNEANPWQVHTCTDCLEDWHQARLAEGRCNRPANGNLGSRRTPAHGRTS